MTEADIHSPSSREQALRNILREDAKKHQPLLQEIFCREMEYRQSESDQAYFGNLYWCAYLLFHVADLRDVEAMWVAKHLNMDTGCGFDVENMVGAGVEQTIEYLQQRGADEAADYIEECLAEDSQADIEQGSRDRRRYFYEG